MRFEAVTAWLVALLLGLAQALALGGDGGEDAALKLSKLPSKLSELPPDQVLLQDWEDYALSPELLQPLTEPPPPQLKIKMAETDVLLSSPISSGAVTGLGGKAAVMGRNAAAANAIQSIWCIAKIMVTGGSLFSTTLAWQAAQLNQPQPRAQRRQNWTWPWCCPQASPSQASP